MTKRIYSNGCVMKLKNKKVGVATLSDSHLGLIFTKLCSSSDEANCSEGVLEVLKDKVKVTRVILSNDAAFALYQALGEMITLDRIPKDCLNLDLPEKSKL